MLLPPEAHPTTTTRPQRTLLLQTLLQLCCVLEKVIQHLSEGCCKGWVQRSIRKVVMPVAGEGVRCQQQQQQPHSAVLQQQRQQLQA